MFFKNTSNCSADFNSKSIILNSKTIPLYDFVNADYQLWTHLAGFDIHFKGAGTFWKVQLAIYKVKGGNVGLLL